MSFIFSYFYDKLMANTEEACLKQWRKELIEQVHGEVLEIGAGTGANVNFYSAKVTQLVLSEPDKNMRKQIQNKIPEVHKNAKIISSTAEQIDAPDESYDYVISTLVCCSVKSLDATFAEIRRVLKPGGSLVFLEHVAAEHGTKRRLWQNRINPFWRKVAGNCHLIRETESEIIKAGFEIRSIQKASMRKAPPIVRPTIRGFAVKV